jgi:rod shape-determining protein MreD
MERRDISPYVASVLLLSVAVLQTSALPTLSLPRVRPDLMLVVVVSWGLLAGTRAAIPWALGGGLTLDLLSGAPFGVATVSLLMSTLGLGLGQPYLTRRPAWVAALATLAATAIHGTTYIGLLRLFGRPLPWGPSLLQGVVPGMAVNALSALLVFPALRWLYTRKV